MLKKTQVLVFFLLLFFLACASVPAEKMGEIKKETEETKEEKKDSAYMTQAFGQSPGVAIDKKNLPITNYSFLSSKEEGLQFTITGLYKKGNDGSGVLITNPEMRSRVRFFLSDPDNILASADLKDGITITVTGILTDASATWTKHLELKEILSIKEEPPLM